ncbi:MAG: hypothetical protein ABIG43_01445 [Chloroflexota bacterium]
MNNHIDSCTDLSQSFINRLSIIGIAASFFALLNGFRWGFAGMASCGLALFTALATIKYAGFMAICGLIGSILIMVGSVIIKNKALIEIITGNEKLKNNTSNAEAVRFKAVHNMIQTKHTKNIVKVIKSKVNGNNN